MSEPERCYAVVNKMKLVCCLRCAEQCACVGCRAYVKRVKREAAS